MNRQRYEPTWPLLCILICLFVLSATSPTVWERALERRSPRKSPAARTAVAKRPVQPMGMPLADANPTASLPREPLRLSRARDITPADLDAALKRLRGVSAKAASSDQTAAALNTVAVPAAPSGPIAARATVASLFQPEDLNTLEGLVLPSRSLGDDPLRRADPAIQFSRPLVVAPISGEPRPTRWGEPKALLRQIDELAHECPTRPWAVGLCGLLESVGQAMEDGSDDAAELLADLDAARRQAEGLAELIEDPDLAMRLRRAAFGLDRRLALWRKTVAAGGLAVRVGGESRGDSRRLEASLRTELRRDPAEPSELGAILRDLERYEDSGSIADARRVASAASELARSAAATERDLGRQLDEQYRNANLRLALTREFLNRLIPERPPEHGCVDDVVMGNVVRGQSVTSTRVGVRLIPSGKRLRMALEINGLVSSLTRSHSGPATFLNDSRSSYRATKEVEVGPAGIAMRPATVDVSSDLRLRSVSTDFDGVPLLGALANDIARSQHGQRRDEMNADVERKVFRRAKAQIDGEAEERLNRLADRLRASLLDPLTGLGLNPTFVQAETTADRVTMRLRLAGDEQLGGHTPRPRAPSDSWISVQVHESALNNLVARLELDGGTFTVEELRRRVAERLKRPELLRRPLEDQGVTIAFAAKDAARVRCGDGRVAVHLSVARLARGSQAWENFQVQAFYTPQVSGRQAVLVRDDVVHLIGQRLSTRSQIALRGVFTKVFAKDQPVPLVPEKFVTDPRLAGLVVTQAALDEGWIGVALGQDRAGRGPAVAARRPRTE